jgi:hypothetical protein
MTISDFAAPIAFSTTAKADPPGEKPISKEADEGTGN